jgi:hypothetical protein
VAVSRFVPGGPPERAPFDYWLNGRRNAAQSLGGQPMKYLFLLQTADDGVPELGTPEAERMYADYRVAIEAMARAGVLLECAPLRGASLATTVRVRDGETMLTDGPAAELKEQVGGYTLVDCADLDQALTFAAMLPAARAGSVEVRAVIEPGSGPATAR